MLLFGAKITGEDEVWYYATDALQSGIKGLCCPFCDTPLVIKKPSKDKPTHFSHRRSACRWVGILRRLMPHFPAPDYWLYGISLGEKRLFNKLQRQRSRMDNDTFISYRKTESSVLLLGKNHPIYDYEPLGKARYDTLEQLRERQLVRIRHFEFGVDVFELSWKTKLLWQQDQSLKEIYRQVSTEWQSRQEGTRWEDLTLNWVFSEMVNRLQQACFYLLRITLDGKVIYKTGTTILPLEQIIEWQRRQLKRYGKQIAIEVIYYMDSIALIEPFIRMKYKKYIYKIGYQRGYFDFKKQFASFKQDLHHVTLLSKQHKQRIKAGLKKAHNVGKRGKETLTGFLEKPKSQAIIALFQDEQKNWSLRNIAFKTGSSVNTVRKVKKCWQEQQNS